MSKGFQSDADETKIQIGVKRLLPSAKRRDIHAFADGVRQLQQRYGHDVADESMRRVMESHPDIADGIIDVMPDDIQREFHAKSIEIMVDVIEEAGLKIEENIRVSDEGIGLTKAAVKAIAATGYPQIKKFGEGNETLEGMGLKRLGGFMHPLSETHNAKELGLPEDGMNMWAVASIIVSGAFGWIEASVEKCEGALKEAVLVAAPTTDVATLMKRSRYDDRALLRLCNLVQSGMDAKARAVFESR